MKYNIVQTNDGWYWVIEDGKQFPFGRVGLPCLTLWGARRMARKEAEARRNPRPSAVTIESIEI